MSHCLTFFSFQPPLQWKISENFIQTHCLVFNTIYKFKLKRFLSGVFHFVITETLLLPPHCMQALNIYDVTSGDLKQWKEIFIKQRNNDTLSIVYLEPFAVCFRASGTVYTAIDIATGQEVGFLYPPYFHLLIFRQGKGKKRRQNAIWFFSCLQHITLLETETVVKSW